MHTLVLTEWVVLLVVAFGAATLAAVSGFGGAALLLPVLALFFGLRDAVPILTVAQLIGNGSRVYFNRRQVNYPIIGWFSVGAIPMAVVGGALFAVAPLGTLTRLLGVFLIVIVVWRRVYPRGLHRPPLKSFALIGGVSSLISALLGSVGPLVAPFFLASGLVKAAYIGTEALAAVVMHVTKLFVYGKLSLLSISTFAHGMALGPVMIGGSFVGQRIVHRLSERVFVAVVEAAILMAGVLFLVRG